MSIKKLLSKKRHNDIELIHVATGISRTTISNAFIYGKASEKTIAAISNYYKPVKLAK